MYRDRIDAGERLAEALRPLVRDGGSPALVLGIPRGGVPIARVVADRLGADLDVVVPHKLRAPSNPELAFGAVAAEGRPVIDDDVVRMLGIAPDYIEREIARERGEIARRLAAYRANARPVEAFGRVCIVVDDGLATGATAEAAVLALRARGAARIVVAVPVGSTAAVARLRRVADEVVCPSVPDRFVAVGQWYDRFEQVPDENVVAALHRPA